MSWENMPSRMQVLAPQPRRPKRRIDKRRPVERHRRQRGVDAAAVGQPGVDHRRAFVDPPADAGGDPLDDPHQVVGVAEAHVGLFQPAEALDVDLVAAG